MAKKKYNANTRIGPTAPPPVLGNTNSDIVQCLTSYKKEAEDNRKGGMNPRDDKWSENSDLYWNRYDFSEKADWQAKETMAEVPAFVDRFAAAMKEALVATSTSFYTVVDPYDQEGDMSGAIKRMMDAWLSTCGRNQLGTPLDFPAVFEEQMKLGAIMACSSVVLWKNDVPGGRVAIEAVDPRDVYLDHTYRNLYRVRTTELELHEVLKMGNIKSGKGEPLYNLADIAMLGQTALDRQRENEELTGHGAQVSSKRNLVTLDEYIATVADPFGNVICDNQLMVVANGEFLIRGPEDNPFWHGRDWLVYAPLVSAPLSVYGRSYMEDFGSLAKVFNELTNLLLDAAYTSALKAFVLVPGMLLDPRQATTGIGPNKQYLLEEGFRAEDFAKELELGTIDAGAITMWQQIKASLAEAARINEIGLGQFAPNSRTSATEIGATMQSSSALVRSVAQTVESRYLNPTLDLGWKTGLQHAKAGDKHLEAAAGAEMYGALLANRRELIKRPLTFQARGISAMIQKSQLLQSLLQLMQIIGSNEALMAAFMQQVDINRLMTLLFDLSNVDITKLQTTQREQTIQNLIAPVMSRASGAPEASGQAQAEMGNVAQTLGIGKRA